MKFLYLILTGLMFSGVSAAQGPKIGMSTRLDYKSDTTEVDVSGSKTTSNEEYFSLNNADVWLLGAVTPRSQYYINYNLARTTGTHARSGPGILMAYLTHKVTPMFSVAAGKINVRQGSREAAQGGFNTIFASGITYPSHFLSGIQGQISVAGQNFFVQVANPTGEASGTSQKGKHFTKSLSWFGNIAGGMILPIVSWSTYPTVPGESGNLKEEDRAPTMIGVGFRVNLPMLELDLENTTLTTEKHEAFDDASTPTALVTQEKSEENATIAKFAWLVPEPKLKVWLKYAAVKKETGSTTDMDQSLMALGLDYSWDPDAYAIYSLNYATREDDPGAGTKTTTNTFMLSMRAKL